MDAYYRILKKAHLPMLYLNLGIMAVCGFALVNLDLWRSLWVGIIAWGLSIPLFPFILFPSALFSGFANMANGRKDYKNAARFMFLSACWIVAMVAVYIAGSISVAAAIITPETQYAALGWAVAVGVLPWVTFAIKDRSNLFVIGLAVKAEIAALVTVLVLKDYQYGFFATFAVMFVLTGGLLLAQNLIDDILIKRAAKKT